MKQRYNL